MTEWLRNPLGHEEGGESIEGMPSSMPPPFTRMVAVNSDVEFTSWEAQVDLFRLFADRELETAYSYWFFGDPAYTWHLFDLDLGWTPQTASAFELARAGFLDTLHSFGGVMNGRGVDFDRALIERAYAAVEAEGVLTNVYTNHGTQQDTQNIGGYWVNQPGTLNYQEGDLPGRRRYHLDRTLRHGVRFFWVDIDRAREQLRFLPEASGRADDLFVPQVSRDGNPILRFRRTDTGTSPFAAEFGEQVKRVLEAPSGGYTVLYTHLGVRHDANNRPIQNVAPYLSPDGLEALDELARSCRDGETLVTTTRRLLTHALLMAARPWAITNANNSVHVRFKASFEYMGVPFTLNWQDLAGFAIEDRGLHAATASLGEGAPRNLERWMVGRRTFVGFPWHRKNLGGVLESALSVAPC